MRGKKAARAAPMLALAAISCCSAWRMSGRRVSRSDGKPGRQLGEDGAASAAVAAASRSAGRGWPSSSTSAFWSCARWRCCCARAARAPASSDSAWRRSSADEAPLSKRSWVRRSDSSRVASVCCVIAAVRRRPAGQLGVGHRRDQADLHGLARLFAGQVLRQRGSLQAAHAAEEVELVGGDVQARGVALLVPPLPRSGLRGRRWRPGSPWATGRRAGSA